MAYVVTDACIKDFLCVDECAMSAIAPGKGDPQAADVTQVFIDPDACIDCGSCQMTCGNGAIFQQDELPADKAGSIEMNAAFFK